jgi:polyphosphate kinase
MTAVKASLHPKEPESKEVKLLDRDASILEFNLRVLDWAKRDEVPLLERLRYLCIVSSNLDELFEVRAMLHLEAFNSKDHSGLYTSQTFKSNYQKAAELVTEQYRLYNDTLLPALRKASIQLLSHGERNAAQKKWVQDYFVREVKPLLVPVGLDPAHPFPQVATKSLNFIVQLGGKDVYGRHNDIAIVKVPRVLPRLIRLPDKLSGNGSSFVLLSSVIRAHLSDLFPGREMGQFSQFRVTRNSELAVDEDDVENLRTALRQGLQHRQYGQPVRLEVSDSCTEHLGDFLLKQFKLPKAALFRVAGPVNLVRLSQLIDLVNEPSLMFAPYHACYPKQLEKGASIFAQMKKGDVLIHQPFESYEGVLDFLREAVRDPQVLAIKQTIYRIGNDTVMLDLLREAVRRGKEVTAVVELKARFDEEANINVAEQLESVGAQVVYGVVGLKTHAKMLLVTRREGKLLKKYGHLSTGNYNPRTAKLYTDISYLTCDAKLTADMDHVFMHLASQSRLGRMNKLWVAPFYLQRKIIAQVDAVGAAALKGQAAKIMVKMNALTDADLIHALIRAGQAGAQIDLIVRGACMLPAQVQSLTDNIRVRSVVGRFLEHTRVFYFAIGEQEQLYLSSADWMNRNMLRRIELAWPVEDPVLRQRVIDECLTAYLQDGRNAWCMMEDGQYQKFDKKGRYVRSAQAQWMARYSAGSTQRK